MIIISEDIHFCNAKPNTLTYTIKAFSNNYLKNEKTNVGALGGNGNVNGYDELLKSTKYKVIGNFVCACLAIG
jgi:hypothetical protein